MSDTQVAALARAEWDWITQRATDYRLLPLLHAAFDQKPDWPVPVDLRDLCLKAYRHWTFRSLTMQNALLNIADTLDANGITYAALKGASLSVEFYAAPALRPMRDLDILVAPDEAERAYSVLQEAGFAKVPGKGEWSVDRYHHLPLLQNDGGVFLELHHRIAPTEWSGSLPLAQRILANARVMNVQGKAVRMVHPTDNALHLIVHAALQNLFDNGPVLLADLHALAAAKAVDWEAVTAFSREHGLEPSVALCLTLFRSAGGRAECEDATEQPVPAPLAEQARQLMTQDLDLHWHRHLLRKRRSLSHRLFGGIARAFRPTARDLSRTAGRNVSGVKAARHYPGWLMAKARVYLGAEFVQGLDEEAGVDAHLVAWLYGTKR
ncbi:MAG: nucleotidyltransferase family protein [Pseudomonadota bacterium]